MNYFDFDIRLPCRIFTPEEIAKEYGEKATRPIPPNYKAARLSIRNRMELQRGKANAKPWAVYAQHGDGRRVFISAHHSDTAAENKADSLNASLGVTSDFVYTVGERMPGKNNNENRKSETISEEIEPGDTEGVSSGD